jgi:hypothetical protein
MLLPGGDGSRFFSVLHLRKAESLSLREPPIKTPHHAAEQNGQETRLLPDVTRPGTFGGLTVAWPGLTNFLL